MFFSRPVLCQLLSLSLLTFILRVTLYDETPLVPEDDAVGYWSPRTANVDWCEKNYTHSIYINEFWNSFTALLMFVPCWLLRRPEVEEAKSPAFNFLIFAQFCLAAGTCYFHIVASRLAQWFDEGSMLVLVAAGSNYWLNHCEFYFSVRTTKFFCTGLNIYYILLVLLMLILPQAEFLFQFGFLGIGLIFGGRLLLAPSREHPCVDELLDHIFFYMFLGMTCWLFERSFCPALRPLQLHAWWHIFGSCLIGEVIQYLVCNACLQKGKKPELKYFCGVFPYVTLASNLNVQEKSPPHTPLTLFANTK